MSASVVPPVLPETQAAALASPARPIRGPEWVIIGLVLVIASALRLAGLGSQPLWLDEGYSWWDAQQTLSDLWHLVPQCDPHPPLYFAMLKGWIDGFGDGAFAMRMLSALLGIGTTFVVILAGRQIDRKVGWLAGLMFALTPFQVEFGHEARPYTLFCFGASLVLLGGLKVARASRARRRVDAVLAVTPVPAAVRSEALSGGITLTLGCVVTLWANNTSVLVVFALAAALAVLMLVDRDTRWLFKPLMLAMLLVLALWLPYFPVLVEQARGVSSDFWIPKPEGWRFANELRFVVSLSSFDAVWWGVLALAGGLVLMARRGRWREALVLGSLVVVPVALNYGISMTVKPIFIARALIGIAPAAAVLMAASVMLIRSPAMRRSAFAALLLAHVGALAVWYSNYQGKEPWDRIASQVVATDDHRTPGQNAIVLVAANELALPLSHALEEMHETVPMQGAPANFPSPGLDARYPSGKCAPSVLGQDLSSIGQAVRGHSVVYFITRRNNVYDPGNGIVRFLRSLGLRQTAMTTYMPGYLEVHEFVAPVRGHLAAPVGVALGQALRPTH
jgi:mannosyltransferase